MIAGRASMEAEHTEAEDLLARLERVVHRLCCQYSTSPPGALVRPAQRELQAAGALFERRLSPPDARRLAAAAGWLNLQIEDGHARLNERTVVCDSSRIDTLLALPL